MKKIIIIILLLIILIIIYAYQIDDYKEINWNHIVLHDYLPKPKNTKGKIYSNSDDFLSISIKVDSEDDYWDYMEECKNIGYTINAETNTNSYSAENNNNYVLSLYNYEDEYHITLQNKETTETSELEDNEKKEEDNNEINNEVTVEENLDGYNFFIIYSKTNTSFETELYMLNIKDKKCFGIDHSASMKTGHTTYVEGYPCEVDGDISTSITINGVEFVRKDNAFFKYVDGKETEKYTITNYKKAKKIYDEYKKRLGIE